MPVRKVEDQAKAILTRLNDSADQVESVTDQIDTARWRSSAAIASAEATARHARARADRVDDRVAQARQRAEGARRTALDAETIGERTRLLEEAELHEETARTESRVAAALQDHAEVDEQIVAGAEPPSRVGSSDPVVRRGPDAAAPG